MSEHDRTAIIDVLNLYAFALDSHQFDLFDLVFTEDVRAEFGPAGAVWQDLVNLKRTFAEFHKTLDNHQHQMMGHVVHVDGNKANAFCYGNWLLVREGTEGGSSWLGSGWYDDELVLTDRGWRIRDRIVKLVSWTGNPLVPIPVPEHHPDMATHMLSRACEEGKIRFLEVVKASRLAAAQSTRSMNA